jgi:hypothetical protein
VPAECGIFVTVKKGGKGAHRLEWTTKAGAIKAPFRGIIRMGPADDPEAQMSIATRGFELAKGVPALVVTQETHTDKDKRRHDVLAVVRGRLVHAFTTREGRGSRTRSSVEPVDLTGDGFKELVVMHAATTDEEKADTWALEVYGWRADVAKVIKRTDLRPTVQAGVVGMMRSVEQARALVDNPCMHDMVVLDENSAPLLGEGLFVVGVPAVLKSDAELALEKMSACDPQLQGAVKVIAKGIEVPEDDD